MEGQPGSGKSVNTCETIAEARATAEREPFHEGSLHLARVPANPLLLITGGGVKTKQLGPPQRGGQAVAICQDCGLVVGGIVRRKRLTPKEATEMARRKCGPKDWYTDGQSSVRPRPWCLVHDRPSSLCLAPCPVPAAAGKDFGILGGKEPTEEEQAMSKAE